MKINLTDYPPNHPVVGWAVAKELGLDPEIVGTQIYIPIDPICDTCAKWRWKSPDVMVQLMEKFKISPSYDESPTGHHWYAYLPGLIANVPINIPSRKTPIDAVIACFCKMQGEVDVPEELISNKIAEN